MSSSNTIPPNPFTFDDGPSFSEYQPYANANMQQATPVQPGSMPGKQMISIDMNAFVITRDALCSSFITLSNSLDKAVKAYLDHTNAVINGNSTLNVTYLTQPFQTLSDNVQHLAQQAMQHGQQLQLYNGAAMGGAEQDGDEGNGKKKKRAYRKRDPGAPKRPLTAYFRYLGERRPSRGAELADAAKEKGETQKPGELSKVATARWNALQEHEKQPYRDAYNHALKDYTDECRKFKAAGGVLDPSDEKRIAAADKGLKLEEGTEHAVDEEDNEDADEVEVPVDPKPGVPVDEDSSSSDESTDDEDDEEVAKEPTPPPPPPVKVTPKAAKKGKQAAAPVAPTPQFSSINPETTAPAPSGSSASPDRKRKASAAAEAPPGKKRGRKSNAEKGAAEADPSPPAPAVVEPEKKKRRKKGGDA